MIGLLIGDISLDMCGITSVGLKVNVSLWCAVIVDTTAFT
jgi:hypothetical protein